MPSNALRQAQSGSQLAHKSIQLYKEAGVLFVRFADSAMDLQYSESRACPSEPRLMSLAEIGAPVVDVLVRFFSMR